MSEKDCLRLTDSLTQLTDPVKSSVNWKSPHGGRVLLNLTDLTDNLLGGVTRVWLHSDLSISRSRTPPARESVKSVKCGNTPAPSLDYRFTGCGQTGVKQGANRGQIRVNPLTVAHQPEKMSFTVSETSLEKTKYQPCNSLTQHKRNAHATLTEQPKKAQNGDLLTNSPFLALPRKAVGAGRERTVSGSVASHGVGLRDDVKEMNETAEPDQLPELNQCCCDPCSNDELEPYDYCLECLESGCRAWEPHCDPVPGVSE